MKRLLIAALCTMGAGALSAVLAVYPAPGGGGDQVPSFTFAWSEYPSWSVFGVAEEIGLLAKMEQKWNVKIKCEYMEYEKCMDAYSKKTVDATCMTNMDTLVPALARKAVAILPTSTSAGADALLAVGVESLKELKDKKIPIYGLPASVSQYTFARIVELNGFKDSDFQFKEMDPDKAALAMQTKDPTVTAIMVWNPAVLTTLQVRKDAKRLGDSSLLKEEIIDMVVVAQDALDKPGGDRFAAAIIETFYEFNKMLDDPAKRDGLLVKLGKKYTTTLNKEEMAVACTETRFYKTPDAAVKLIESQEFSKTMNSIVGFWVSHKFLKEKPPTLGFGSAEKDMSAQFRFDPTYIKAVRDRK